MSYRGLKAFHSVALYGGFSRASERVFLTQPALSEQVRRLEQAHDVLLFRREKKRVFLTEAGTQLFHLTTRLFEVEQEITDYLVEKRTTVEGELRIIVDSATHISSVLSRFRQQFPEVFVTLKTSNTEDMLEQLRAYRADLAIGGGIGPGADLKRLDLGATAIVAVAAKGYLPAKRRRLRLSELCAMPVMLREKGSKTRELVEREARRRQLTLNVVMEVEGREAMREIIGTGAGVGFVSEAEFGNDDRLRKYDISDARLTMQESLFYLSQRSEVRIIKSFIEFAAGELE